MKRSGIIMLLAALFISTSSFAAMPHMTTKMNTQTESIHRKHRKQVKKTKTPKKTRTPQTKAPGQ